MKQQLALRNRILEFEKANEKMLNETVKDMDSKLTDLRKDGAGQIDENAVKVNELQENVLSMKAIERKKVIYELELFEWG